jgi:cobalt/nickel transport system permease protein
MHMADALLSPAMGGAFWAASGGLIAHSAKKVAQEDDPAKTPLMGVVGAFVFAAQMVNFTIPGTGSSGHLGGGLLLAVLLGPHRAFLTLASVLVVQCLLFADGGLMALGCNIFNLAFFPAFAAYPFVFRVIAGRGGSPARLAAASIAAGVAGLLMGSLAVVVQTTLSGISDLPFGPFAAFMVPIHLAIGLVEGVVTWGVLSFVARVQPSLLAPAPESRAPRLVFAVFALAALGVGGVVSWFASSSPDGLEWSVARTAGREELSGRDSALRRQLAAIQEKLAILPDYRFKRTAPETGGGASAAPARAGTSASGVVGSLLALALAFSLGLVFRRRNASRAGTDERKETG